MRVVCVSFPFWMVPTVISRSAQRTQMKRRAAFSLLLVSPPELGQPLILNQLPGFGPVVSIPFCICQQIALIRELNTALKLLWS